MRTFSFEPFSYKIIPQALKAIMIANVVGFITQVLFDFNIINSIFGLVPEKVINHFSFWQVITYMFLHGSPFHLLWNLFILWMIGRHLEQIWGPTSFLNYYFLTGVGAAILHIATNPFSVVPTIGASGAIYGLLAAFAIYFPDSVFYMWFIIPIKAKHLVIILGVIEFLFGYSGAQSGVANFAHLGGLLTGVLYLKGNMWWLKFKSTILPQRKSRQKRKRPPEVIELSKEVDRILEKVLRYGAESLSEEEKYIMERYSKLKH